MRELEQLTAQLQQRLAEGAQGQQALQAQLDDAAQKALGLETFRRALESRVSHTEAESSERGHELQRLRDQVATERHEAQRHVARVRGELEERIAALEAVRTQLLQDLQQAQTALARSQDDGAALRATLGQQAAALLELESQVAALKARLQAAQAEAISRALTCDALAQQLAHAQDEAALLRAKLHEAEALRRRLHNTVQELRGNIRVFCRVRPLLPHERSAAPGPDPLGHIAIVKHLDEPEEISLALDTETALGQAGTKVFPFRFDRVFGPHASQRDVFDEIAQLVQSALDGYRVCIFAYGQTGSGKTFTMEGAPADPALLGMIPRAVQQVFDTASALAHDRAWQFAFEASYLEIYNEAIRDLLGPGDDTAKHEIRHLPNSSRTTVTDLTVVPVSTPEAVLAFLSTASRNRAVAETHCNDRSSRSHRYPPSARPSFIHRASVVSSCSGSAGPIP